MKRVYILIFVIIYALATCGCLHADSEKYSYGRDTVVRVGEGRFDICRFGDVNNERYGVVDVDTQENIEDNVSKYYDYKRVGKLYLIGDNGYTVIDYENTKTYEQHTNLYEFSASDQKIFNDKRFDIPGRILNIF